MANKNCLRGTSLVAQWLRPGTAKKKKELFEETQDGIICLNLCVQIRV